MPAEITIPVKRLRPGRDADLPLPGYMTGRAAGMDLYAAVTTDIILAPGQIVKVPTGIALAIPAGFEGQVRPRSGLALKHGISLVNSPGTIDADYRGELFLPVINLGPRRYRIRRGDRMAQLVILPVVRARLVETDDLDTTARSQGGFGHTGR